MQNLDQIRAAKAYSTVFSACNNQPAFDRSDIAKLPAMILSNGLLPSLAFAMDGREKMQLACDGLAAHLADPRLGISLLEGKHTANQLSAALRSETATYLDLQRATSEALAFLTFLKRFAPPKDNTPEPPAA